MFRFLVVLSLVLSLPAMADNDDHVHGFSSQAGKRMRPLDVAGNAAGEKENSGLPVPPPPASPIRAVLRDVTRVATPDTPPGRAAKRPCVTPISRGAMASPARAERSAFRPLRERVALARSQGSPFSLEDLEDGYRDDFPRNYFVRQVTFGIGGYSETVFQSDPLFDKDMPVVKKVNGQYVWHTNLEWMKRGRAPVAYKADVSDEMLSDQEAYEYQRAWGIELHHILQDQGVHGIAEMTRQGHRSLNDRAVVDAQSGEIQFVAGRIDPAEGAEIFTDTLHVVRDESSINRSRFDRWRAAYWKHRAAQIEKGVYDYRPAQVERIQLYGGHQNPRLEMLPEDGTSPKPVLGLDDMWLQEGERNPSQCSSPSGSQSSESQPASLSDDDEPLEWISRLHRHEQMMALI